MTGKRQRQLPSRLQDYDVDMQEDNAQVSDVDSDTLAPDSDSSLDERPAKSRQVAKNSESYEVRPLPEQRMTPSSRYMVVKKLAEDLDWRNPFPKKRNTYIYESLLSSDAMYHAKWYQDLPEDMTSITEEDMDNLKYEIRTAADGVKALYQMRSFQTNGRAVFFNWIEYCNQEKYAGDYGVSSVQKVREFLDFREKSALNAKQRRKQEDEHTRLEATRKVSSFMDHLAGIQGYTFTSKLFEQPAIKSFITLIRQDIVAAGKKPCDIQGISEGNTKSLTREEQRELATVLWEGVVGNDLVNMRAYVLHMMNTTVGRRSHELRELFMPSIGVRLVDAIGPVAGNVLVATIRHVKSYDNDNQHVISWIHTPDPMLDPLAAIANYLVFLIDIVRHPVLSQMKLDLKEKLTWHNKKSNKTEHPPPSTWWSMKFVYGSDFFKELSYDSHADYYKQAVEKVTDQKKSAVLHMARHMVAKDQIERGVSHTEVAKHQTWACKDVSGAMDNYVRAAVKVAPMMTAHGWENQKEYFCWRSGPEDGITEDMKKKIMPDLDRLLALAEDVYRTTKADLSAVEFLKTLKFLRKVVLENAVDMMDKFPNFPMYKHPFFATREWKKWKAEELTRRKFREDTHYSSKRDPEATKVMRAHNELFKKQAQTIASLQESVTELTSRLPPAGVAGPSNSNPMDEEEEDVHQGRQPVPFIPMDVVSIQFIYNEWVTRLLPYFAVVGKPHWNTKIHGRGPRQRYDRFVATCLYIDYVVKYTSLSAEDVFKRLLKVAKAVDMEKDQPNFVKITLNNFFRKGFTDAITKNAFIANGLPLKHTDDDDLIFVKLTKVMWNRNRWNVNVS